jgi:predicted amidohydrolase YtcJ
MSKTKALTLIITFIVGACNQKEHADLIVHNAKIYSVNERLEIFGALVVRDGKIVALGSEEEILGGYQSKFIVDAGGKPIFPGFIDAHCHFFGYALNLVKSADLTGSNSFREVIERVKKHAEQYPSEWIEGRGWDQNDWEVKEFPAKELLDSVFPDKPVYLSRIDGHAAVLNSIALKKAGITARTKVYGGEIHLRNGEPTGILIDNAIDKVARIITHPPPEIQQRALQEAEKNCFMVGLTSVQDAGLGRDTIELIDKMHREGSLLIRIYAMISATSDNLDHFLRQGRYETERLNVRSFKLYADGALGSRGARMTEPYSDDPGNNGLFMFQPDFYKRICSLALENGFQVNTHAIGDEGNRFVLQLYSEFLKDKNDLRWRIEHAQVIHPGDFDLFGKFSVVPSVQPTHATSDMYWGEERIGKERMKGAYAYKRLLEENGWLPLGTDFPVENINPLYTFYAAVARKDLTGFPAEGFQMENALTRQEALRGMTIWAAKAAFEENIKGSLEPGKFADFIILDQDIMTIPIDSVPQVKVLSTWSGGQKVYDSR